uniref:GK24228, related n=1 Tax=Neospora caninum (strain Liverpool) TaxID=572307 RepID=A0A0F7UC43_NEOCL|nr:TPA: GK24228, related [Neospora caninum Liverpool]
MAPSCDDPEAPRASDDQAETSRLSPSRLSPRPASLPEASPRPAAPARPSKRSRVPPLAPVDAAPPCFASLSSFEADASQTPLAYCSLAALRRRHSPTLPPPALSLFSASFVAHNPLRCIYSELHTLLTVIRVASAASGLSASHPSAALGSAFGDALALPPPLSGFVESVESLLATLHRQIQLQHWQGADWGRRRPCRHSSGARGDRADEQARSEERRETRGPSCSSSNGQGKSCAAPGGVGRPSELDPFSPRSPFSPSFSAPLSPLAFAPPRPRWARVDGAHLAPFLFVVADLWPLVQQTASGQGPRAQSLANVFSVRPVVAGALASLTKFVAYDFLAPEHCVDAALLANQVVQAVLACAHQQLQQLANLALSPRTFVFSPPLQGYYGLGSGLAGASGGEEEVVLYRAISLLLDVVRSSAGPLVADDGVWEVLKLCYFVVHQPKISGVLRSHTEAALSELVVALFAPRRQTLAVALAETQARASGGATNSGDAELSGSGGTSAGETGGERPREKAAETEKKSQDAQGGRTDTPEKALSAVPREGSATPTAPSLGPSLGAGSYRPHGLGGLYMTLRFIAFLVAHGLPFSSSSSRAPPSLRGLPLGGEPKGAPAPSPDAAPSRAVPSPSVSANAAQGPPSDAAAPSACPPCASETELVAGALSPGDCARLDGAACAVEPSSSLRKMEADLLTLYDFSQKGKGDEDFYLEMRALGLTLLNCVLEAAGRGIARSPALRHVVSEEIAWAIVGGASTPLLGALGSRDSSLLMVSVQLRALWNLRTFRFPLPATEATLLQTVLLRVLASPLHLMLYQPPPHALGPPGTSAAGVQAQYQSVCQHLQQQVATHDFRFVTLEALVELCALPDFLPQLFVHFDCNVRAPADICAQIVALLVFLLLSPSAPPLPSLQRLQQFCQAVSGKKREEFGQLAGPLAAGDENLAALNAANARLLPPYRGVYRDATYVSIPQDAEGQCSPLPVAPDSRVPFKATRATHGHPDRERNGSEETDAHGARIFFKRRNFYGLALAKRRQAASGEASGGALFDFSRPRSVTELNRLALRGVLEVLALMAARVERQRARCAAAHSEKPERRAAAQRGNVNGEAEGTGRHAQEDSGEEKEEEEREEKEEEEEEREEREQEARSAAAETLAQAIIASGKTSAATAFALVQPLSRLRERRERKRRIEAAAALFNANPKTFIPHLEDLELLPSPATPRAVAAFLRDTRGLDLVKVGEYLAQNKDWNKQVLVEFLATFAFASVSLVEALRTLLASFRLPGESQQIERIMEAFAGEYFQQQPFVTTPLLPAQLAELAQVPAVSSGEEKTEQSGGAKRGKKEKEKEDPRFGIPRWVISEAAFWRLEDDSACVEAKTAEVLERPRRRSLDLSNLHVSEGHETEQTPDGEPRTHAEIREHLTNKLKTFTPDHPPPGYVSFEHRDTVFVLSYSIVMLNTDLHNSQVKVKMNVEQFLRNNRGINQGKSLPVFFLTEIYLSIRDDEIRMKSPAGSGQTCAVPPQEPLALAARAPGRRKAGVGSCRSGIVRGREHRASHASSLLHFLHKRERRERRRSSLSTLSARSSLAGTKCGGCAPRDGDAGAPGTHAESRREAPAGEGRGRDETQLLKSPASSLQSPSLASGAESCGLGDETPFAVLTAELDALFFFTFWEQGVFDALRGVLESTADLAVMEEALSGILLLAKAAVALGLAQAVNVIVAELCAYVDLSLGVLAQAVIPVLFEILRPERPTEETGLEGRAREGLGFAAGGAVAGGLGGCVYLREEGWAAFLEVLLKFFALDLLPPALANLHDFPDPSGRPLPRLCTLLPPAFAPPAQSRKKAGRRGWLGDLTNLLFAFADTDEDSEGDADGDELQGRAASLTAQQQEQIVANAVLAHDGAFFPSLFDKLYLLRCGTSFAFLPTTLSPSLLPGPSLSSAARLSPDRKRRGAERKGGDGLVDARSGDTWQPQRGEETARKSSREEGANKREEREKQLAAVAPFFRFKAVLERFFKVDELLAQIFTSLPPAAALPLASILVLHTLPLASPPPPLPGSDPSLSQDSSQNSEDPSVAALSVDPRVTPYYPYPRLSAFPPAVPASLVRPAPALPPGSAVSGASGVRGGASPRAGGPAGPAGLSSGVAEQVPAVGRLANLPELLNASTKPAGWRGQESEGDEETREAEFGALCASSMADDVRRFRAVGDRAFALEILGFLVADQGLLLVDLDQETTPTAEREAQASRRPAEKETEQADEKDRSLASGEKRGEAETGGETEDRKRCADEDVAHDAFLERMSKQELVWVFLTTHLNVLIRRYVIAAAAETVQPPLVAVERAVCLGRGRAGSRERTQSDADEGPLERQQVACVHQMLASWGRQLTVETPACLDRDELLFIERLMVTALRLVVEFLPIGASLRDLPTARDVSEPVEAWIEPSVLHLLALIVHLHPNVYMLQTERISAALQLLFRPPASLAALRSPLAIDVFLGILQRMVPLPPFLPPSALPASLLRQQQQQLAAAGAHFLAQWLLGEQSGEALLEVARPLHFQGCVQTLLALSVHTPQLLLLKGSPGGVPRVLERSEDASPGKDKRPVANVERSLLGLRRTFGRQFGAQGADWSGDRGDVDQTGDQTSVFSANLKALKMLNDLPGAIAAAAEQRDTSVAWLTVEEVGVMWVKVLQALAICCAFGPKPVRVKALGHLQHQLLRASPPPSSLETANSPVSPTASRPPSLLQRVMKSPAVWRLVLQEVLFPLLTYGFQYPCDCPLPAETRLEAAAGLVPSGETEPSPVPRASLGAGVGGDRKGTETAETPDQKPVVESPYTFPSESRARRPAAWMAAPLGRRYTLEAAVAALGAEEVLQRRAASASLVCRLFLSHLDFLLQPLGPAETPSDASNRFRGQEGEEEERECALRLLGLVGDQVLVGHFGGDAEAAHAAATAGGLRLLLPPLVQFLELLVEQACAAPLVFCDAFLENLKNTLLVVLTSPAVASASTEGTVDLPPPTAADFDIPGEKREAEEAETEKDGERKTGREERAGNREGGEDEQEGLPRKRVGADGRYQRGSPSAAYFDAALQQLSKSQQLLIVIAHQIISPSFPYLVKDLLTIILPTLLPPRFSTPASASASFQTAEEHGASEPALGENETRVGAGPGNSGAQGGPGDGEAGENGVSAESGELEETRIVERSEETRMEHPSRPPAPPPPPPPPPSGPPPGAQDLGANAGGESVSGATAGDETENPEERRQEDERSLQHADVEGGSSAFEGERAADGEDGSETEGSQGLRTGDTEGPQPHEIPEDEREERRATHEDTDKEVLVTSQCIPREDNRESKSAPRPRTWRETFFGAGAAAAAAALGREVYWTDQALPPDRGQNAQVRGGPGA